MLFLGFHDDRDDAHELTQRLRAVGVEVWCSVSKPKRRPGAPWPDEAVDALYAATCFAVLLGARGVGGGLKDEVSHAQARRREQAPGDLAEFPIVSIVLPSAARNARGVMELPKLLKIFHAVELPSDWKQQDHAYFVALADELGLATHQDAKSAQASAVDSEGESNRGASSILTGDSKAKGSSARTQREPPAAAAKPRGPVAAGPRFIELPKSGLRMASIPGGKFLMGSPESEEGHSSDEGPQHEVHVPPFELCTTPVTNAQYAQYLKESPAARKPEHWTDSAYNQPNQPVVGVSWEEATAYCKWAGLRLPSEAEWEYACRAGTTTRYWKGDLKSDLEAVGWFDENSGGKLHIVGAKPSNAFGLHDMHGNVWDWCEDWFHESYEDAPTNGTAWVDPASEGRVIRGGSFESTAGYARSAFRGRLLPSPRWDYLGFRPARSVTP